MDKYRNQKDIGAHFLLCLIAFTLLAACHYIPTLDELDEIEIYSAVIRQIYTHDDTFGGTFQASTVYVLERTDDDAGDSNIDRGESHTIPEAIQIEIAASLTDIPMQIVWIRDESDVAFNPYTRAVADDAVIITLGNIHLQRGGSAQVSGSVYFSQLAAGGQTYILERIGNEWIVIGTTDVIWIS